VTIRWFTDADRQDMRNAEEERRVLDELELAQACSRVSSRRWETTARLRKIENLQIDPGRRRPE
jgi:hypothetical protein